MWGLSLKPTVYGLKSNTEADGILNSIGTSHYGIPYSLRSEHLDRLRLEVLAARGINEGSVMYCCDLALSLHLSSFPFQRYI